MPYTNTHQGVPILATDQRSAENLSGVNWRPLPAFDALRPVVRARWDALKPNPAGGHAGRERALHAGAQLTAALELRDARGALIPTESIELRDLPEAPARVLVKVQLGESLAGKPALRPPRAGQAGDGAPEA
jgi:hypothetical protein